MTGWKVPRPTWRVTLAISQPRTASAPEQRRGEVQARRGRGDGAVDAGEDGLVAVRVLGVVVALDVRR